MKGAFKKTERRGLPGGPNEMFTYTTGVFSTQGYKSNSPDVNNPFNVIPSNKITMFEDDGTPLKKGPVMGVDNYGNKKIMLPGNDYEFPGDYVVEKPFDSYAYFGGVNNEGNLSGGFGISNDKFGASVFGLTPFSKEQRKYFKGLVEPTLTYRPNQNLDVNLSTGFSQDRIQPKVGLKYRFQDGGESKALIPDTSFLNTDFKEWGDDEILKYYWLKNNHITEGNQDAEDYFSGIMDNYDQANKRYQELQSQNPDMSSEDIYSTLDKEGLSEWRNAKFDRSNYKDYINPGTTSFYDLDQQYDPLKYKGLQSRDEYKEYLQSDKYKKIAKEFWGKDSKQYTQKQLDDINAAEYRSPKEADFQDIQSSLRGDYADVHGFYNNVGNYVQMVDGDMSYVIPHETSHLTDRNENPLSDDEAYKYESKEGYFTNRVQRELSPEQLERLKMSSQFSKWQDLENEFDTQFNINSENLTEEQRLSKDYLTKPTEVRARVNAVRNELHKQGIDWNNTEDINKFIQTLPQDNLIRQQYEQLNFLNEDTKNTLFNEYAYQDSGTNMGLAVAQTGGEELSYEDKLKQAQYKIDNDGEGYYDLRYSLPEVGITVTPSFAKDLPYYDSLKPEEKEWLRKNKNSNDAITRGIRAQAKEGYGIDGNPTYGESVVKFATDPFLQMGTIAAEATGIPSAYRISQDPIGTAKGAANTLASLNTLPIGLAKGAYNYYNKGEFDMGNTIMNQPYFEGVDKALDLLGVIPDIGLLAKGAKQGLKKGIPAVRRAYINRFADPNDYRALVEKAAAKTSNMRAVAPSMKRAALRYTNAWRQPQRSLHFDYKKNLDEALNLRSEARGNQNLLIKEQADEIDNAARLFEESRQEIIRTSSSFEDAGQKIKLLEDQYDEVVGGLKEQHKKAIREYDDYFKETDAYIRETEESVRKTSADPDFRAKAKRIVKEGEYTPKREFEKFVDADARYNPTFPNTEARTVSVTINKRKGPESLLKDPNFQKLSKRDQEYLLKNYNDIGGVNTKGASITFLEDIEAPSLKTIQDNVYENTKFNPWNPKKIREAYEKEFQIENKLLDNDYTNKLKNFQETVVHESAHDSQKYMNWLKRLTKDDPEFAYDITKGDSDIAKQFKDVLRKPVKEIGTDGKPAMSMETWEGSAGELHSELDKVRFIALKDWINKGRVDTIEEGVQLLKKMEREGSDKLYKFYDSRLKRHWDKSATYDKKKAVLQMLPALTGFGIGAKLVGENLSEESSLPQQQQGGDVAVRDNTYVDIKIPQIYTAPIDNTRVEKKIVPEPMVLSQNIDFEGLKKGIAQAESLGGVLMVNPESTATGLYGQRFSEIEDSYKGTREDFAKDTTYQEELFKKRFYEGLKDTKTTPLQKDAMDLYDEYNMQFEDFPYSYEDIAALSNFLGRQGTREYFGYVLRDGKPLEEVFPTKYGAKAKQANKTPEEYLKITRPYYTKSDGGEILKVYADYINGVLDDTPMYKKGGRIYDKLNRIYYKDAKKAGMSSPNYIMTYLVN